MGLRLSVILPIYNVETFLERCIRSLESQDIPHEAYEIICVNDGSPDNSRKVVQKLQDEFKNIILVDQENQGVSMARNAGLNKASGKYILFVDPDDLVRENSLGSVLNIAEQTKLQLIIPAYEYLDEHGRVYHTKKFENEGEKPLTGIEAYHFMRTQKELIADSSVGILYETKFLKTHQLFYVPGIVLNQDVEFLARIHCMASRCLFFSEILYRAYARRGSATRSNQFNTDRVRYGFNIAASNLRQFQQLESLRDEQVIFLNGPIVQFVLLALYSAIRTRSLKVLRDTIVSQKQAGISKLDLGGCRRNHLISGRAYNFSPYLAAILFVSYLRIAIRRDAK
ncbi:MAG: glycosyltransferase [Bacteroidales bacterium]|nr:glycosyltransferase [Bacteroidales bacterium]